MDEDKRSKLKRKKLYLLSCVMKGTNESGEQWAQTLYALDVSIQYPWAGGFTDRKEDASAFTSGFLRALKSSNASFVKAGWQNTSYTALPAPKDLEGSIYYLPHELKT